MTLVGDWYRSIFASSHRRSPFSKSSHVAPFKIIEYDGNFTVCGINLGSANAAGLHTSTAFRNESLKSLKRKEELNHSLLLSTHSCKLDSTLEDALSLLLDNDVVSGDLASSDKSCPSPKRAELLVENLENSSTMDLISASARSKKLLSLGAEPSITCPVMHDITKKKGNMKKKCFCFILRR